MTYKELVNHVLRRMREDEVGSVSATTYSQMVGDYVNDAVQIVQDAWDWADLRETKTVTTSDGTDTYAITGASTNAKIFHIIDDTSNTVLRQVDKGWMDRNKLIASASDGQPTHYIFTTTDASGDIQIQLFPTPDDAYSLKVNGVFRTDELTGNDDTVPVPWQPVMHYTIALLARERGETGGQSAQEYFAIADKVLSDHIARESAYYPEETIYRTV